MMQLRLGTLCQFTVARLMPPQHFHSPGHWRNCSPEVAEHYATLDVYASLLGGTKLGMWSPARKPNSLRDSGVIGGRPRPLNLTGQNRIKKFVFVLATGQQVVMGYCTQGKAPPVQSFMMPVVYDSDIIRENRRDGDMRTCNVSICDACDRHALQSPSSSQRCPFLPLTTA